MVLAYLNLEKAYFHFSKKAEYYKFFDQKLGLNHSFPEDSFLYFIFSFYYVFKGKWESFIFHGRLIFQKFGDFFRFVRNHQPLA